MTEFHLVTSDLTPKVTPLLFNYESQTARLLQTLSAKRGSGGVAVVTVTSPYDILAERVLLHASQLLPPLIESNVLLFWYRLYPGSSATAILRHLRNFLIAAWSRHSQAHPNEYAVLTFDDPELASVENLTSAIRSLLLRLVSSYLVAVIEVVDAVPAADLTAVKAAFQNISDAMLSTAISLVFLGSANHVEGAFTEMNAVAIRLEDLPEQWRATFSRAALADHATEPKTSRRSVSDDVLRLVLPLSALQSGVSSEIVQYIRGHMQSSDEDVGDFLRENFIVELQGGLSLSAAGYRIAAEERRNRSAMKHYDTLVSNGSRIIAFVPPENLASGSALQALEKYVSTNFRVIDHAAAMLTATRTDFAAAKRKAEMLAAVIQEDSEIFQRSNEMHHSTLIAYMSQLLMRPRYNLDYTFFRMLEMLTFGLCEYLIQHVLPRNDAVYRASRLVTNIGYVYDRLPAERKQSVQVRQGIFARAADLLGQYRPLDRADIERYTYAEGWQLLDAGLTQRAAEVFLRGAKLLAQETSDVLDAIGDPRVFSLLGLVYVIRRGEMQDAWAETELERRVQATGIFDSLAELRDFLFGSVRTLDIGRRYFGARPNVAVFFCRYDFPGTLLTVRNFVFQLGLIPRLHLVAPAEPISLDAHDLLHAIIGSPDTPDGVGDLICRVNPTAAYLYQLKSTEDFSDLQVATYEGRTFISPSGAGPGNYHSQWNEFWSARRESKESTMSDLILGTLVTAVLSSAGEKLTEVLFDGIVDRVKAAVQRLRGKNTLEAKDEADFAELRADLQQLPEAVRRKGVLTTGDVAGLLRLDKKSSEVAMQVSSLLAPGGLSEIFAQVIATADVVGSDVYQAREIMEGTRRLATRVRELHHLTLEEQLWLDKYQIGVRNSIVQAKEISSEYEATNEFDARAFNKLVNNFCVSTRRFASLMGDVEKRYGMRDEARGEL